MLPNHHEKQVPFIMAIENVVLMHKFCLQHLHIGTVKMEYNKEVKHQKVNIKISKVGTKEKFPMA